jgi:hypothetical protein
MVWSPLSTEENPGIAHDLGYTQVRHCSNNLVYNYPVHPSFQLSTSLAPGDVGVEVAPFRPSALASAFPAPSVRMEVSEEGQGSLRMLLSWQWL